MGVYIEWMDGTAYAAANWDDLAKVVKLDTIITPPSSSDEWMDKVSSRVLAFEGHNLIYTDPETFFKELFRVGILNDLREKGESK